MLKKTMLHLVTTANVEEYFELNKDQPEARIIQEASMEQKTTWTAK